MGEAPLFGLVFKEINWPPPGLVSSPQDTTASPAPSTVSPAACNPDPLSTRPHTDCPTLTALGTPVSSPNVWAFPHAAPSGWNGLPIVRSQGSSGGNSRSSLVPH